MRSLRKIHLSSLLDILVQLEKDGVEYIDISGKHMKKVDRCFIDVWDDYFHPDSITNINRTSVEEGDDLQNLIG